MVLQVVLLFLLHVFFLSHGYEDVGSGCQNHHDPADLCFDESGSGAGSGDVSLEVPRDNTLRSVCRSSQLETQMSYVSPDPVQFYSMVQDCPKMDPFPDSSRCEFQQDRINMADMSLLLPVTSLSTNVTYFNHDCFLCAGDPGPGVTWALNVSCTQWVDLQSLSSETEVLQAALDSEHCFMGLQPPTNIPTERCWTVQPTEITEPLYVDEQHEPGGLNLPDIPGRVGGPNLPDMPRESSDQLPHRSGAPISILLRFTHRREGGGGSRDEKIRGGIGKHVNESGGIMAGGNSSCSGFVVSVFDEDMCFSLNCAPGKRLEGNTCRPVIGRSRGLHYSLTLLMDVFVRSSDVEGRLTSQLLSSLCSLEELVKAGVTQHTSSLHSEAYDLTGWILTDHADTILTSLDVVHNVTDDLYFDVPTLMSNENGDDVDVTIKEFRLGRVLVWFDFFVTSDADRNSVEQSALRMSEEEWHVICGHTHSRLVPTLTHRENVKERIFKDFTNQNVTDSFRKPFTESVTHWDFRRLRYGKNPTAMRVSPLLMCPFLVFSKDHYEMEQLSVTEEHNNIINLTLINITETVPSSELETDDEGQLKICESLFKEKFEESLKSGEDLTLDPDGEEVPFWALLEHYVSLVCVCLSLFCLILTVLTYTLFRSLRTIPGQNTMGLCCNLFLAQAFLQFGVNWTELRGGCIALGMLIHYFWLASILWMNACSFHMHRVFTAKRAARMSSTHVRCCTRRVVAYGVYAQGVPLVVIGTTVSVSIFLSEGHEIGYGGAVCYLSSPYLVGAAFAAPLGLVLILNLVFFLRAAWAIRKTEMPVEMNRQNGHRSPSPNINLTAPYPSAWRRNLNACIRLSSLTGLFWTLGIVAELLDQRVLRLISVMVNGSQGVLIALSYLANRRVFRLYSQLCCTCRNRKQQPGSITTVSGSLPSGGNTAVTQLTSANSVSRNTNGHLHNSDVVQP